MFGVNTLQKAKPVDVEPKSIVKERETGEEEEGEVELVQKRESK